MCFNSADAINQIIYMVILGIPWFVYAKSTTRAKQFWRTANCDIIIKTRELNKDLVLLNFVVSD